MFVKDQVSLDICTSKLWLRTVCQGTSKTQQTWESVGKERKMRLERELREDWEAPVKGIFFQSHRKIQWLSCERKKRKSRLCGSMSRWGYQAIGLYFYPWLGRGAPWGDAGPVLDLLCPASQWGTQTLPACLFTHFSRKGQKRGEIHRSTGGFILFTWCYNCLFAYMPHLFIN